MGTSFGYNTQESDASYLTGDQLISTLVSTVAHGGNLLLNIGPKADGTIPKQMVDRLRLIGDWLTINGEAIYGTRRWTQPEAGDVRFTVGAAEFVYATVLSWPGQELEIDAPLSVDARRASHCWVPTNARYGSAATAPSSSSRSRAPTGMPPRAAGAPTPCASDRVCDRSADRAQRRSGKRLTVEEG